MSEPGIRLACPVASTQATRWLASGTNKIWARFPAMMGMITTVCLRHMHLAQCTLRVVPYALPFEGGSFLRTIVAQRDPSSASSLRTPVGRPCLATATDYRSGMDELLERT